MKPFSKLIKNQDNLNKRIAKIKNQVINDSDVKQFLNQHQSELTKNIKINKNTTMVTIMHIVQTLLKVIFQNYI